MSKIKKNNTRFKQTELGKIPEEWQVRNLAEVVQPNRGISYGIVQTGEPVEKGIPCIRVVDIVKPKISVEDLITTTPEISSSYRRTVLQENDIIFALRGEIGHVVIADKSLVGANLTRGVALIAPNEKIEPKFLLWAIRSPMVRSEILFRVNGSALREIPIGGLKQVKIPVPPLPEQKKIAEILSSVDEAIASTQAVIDQTRKVKQGLLQQLLTCGIGHTRFKESAIGQIPEAWEVKTAGEVCQLITKGTTPRDGNFSKELGDVPYLRVQNLTFDGRLNFYVNPAFISSEIHNGELKRSRTFPGDVLINIVGPPLGKISMVTSEYPEWNINQAIAIFRTSSNYNNKLLAYWLQTPQVLDWFLCRSKKTTSQQNLTLQLCNELPVPLPSLSEQYQIVEHLESIDFQIHTENESLLSLVNVKQGLMQDLLTGRVRVGVTP
ncbi:hypothetical protein NSTC745_01743 [Nostoc sp. DSM 114161]|jgi:type I restriction enzyme S subunit|uniref:restriction endonuclease subunit S n=1 Tax=Nostoc sp. DSM 114161 TaxID=3440143 RepID=UPI0040463292